MLTCNLITENKFEPPSSFHKTSKIENIPVASDSGATGIVIRSSDQKVLSDVVPDTRIRVEIPNGQVMKPSHRGYIRLPGVPDVEIEAYVLPDLARHSLLSHEILCDAGLTANLDHGMIIIY